MPLVPLIYGWETEELHNEIKNIIQVEYEL